jgi:fatty-acyl-CoA synthase
MLLRPILARAEHLWPNREALVCGNLRLTWAQAAERVLRLANGLAARGIGRGTQLAILHPNCHVFFEAYHAAAWIGATLVPLNVRLAPKELAAIVDDAECRLLVVAPELASLAREAVALSTARPELLESGAAYEALLASSSAEAPPEPETEEDDPAQLYYTSGTTGRAKGVVLSHRNVASHALAAIAELRLDDADRWLHAAPMFHLADAWATFAVTWVGGAHVFVPRFEASRVLDALERERITITNLIPTMLTLLLQEPDAARRDFSGLKRILSGGAPIAPETVRRIVETFRCEYVQTYGMTETSPYLTLSVLKEHLRRLPADEQLRYRSRTGRPFLGVELKVVREDGTAVRADDAEVGEILVRGDSVTRGYWKLPAETAQALRGGWLATGDLATVEVEGFVNIVDRKKDMIITGGENVYSTEVEHVLVRHPAVLEAAVIGVPDATWGETVKAVVALRRGAKATAEELIAFCRGELARYKCPRIVELVDELPRLGSGKIAKRALRGRVG